MPRYLHGPWRPATHCYLGHEMTEANTRVKVTKKYVLRVCRKCHRQANRLSYNSRPTKKRKLYPYAGNTKF